MARSALPRGRKIGQGPRAEAAYVPAASVVLASLLGALPIVTTTGWFPDLGFLMLIAWRLLRGDVWPAWWATPLGLLNDLVSGAPIGFSVALWTAAMLFLDLIERRTMWRDYWIDWALAGMLLFAYETAEWRVAQMMGASLPFAAIVPPLVISVLSFPIAAWFAFRLDSWRLGR